MNHPVILLRKMPPLHRGELWLFPSFGGVPRSGGVVSSKRPICARVWDNWASITVRRTVAAHFFDRSCLRYLVLPAEKDHYFWFIVGNGDRKTPWVNGKF
jgi:hypothetical protein